MARLLAEMSKPLCCQCDTSHAPYNGPKKTSISLFLSCLASIIISMSIVSVESTRQNATLNADHGPSGMQLLRVPVSGRLDTCLALLVELVALVRGVLHGLLAGVDLLDGGEDD